MLSTRSGRRSRGAVREVFDEARRYVESGEAATLQIVSAALKD
jgi:hypothetical protein